MLLQLYTQGPEKHLLYFPHKADLQMQVHQMTLKAGPELVRMTNLGGRWSGGRQIRAGLNISVHCLVNCSCLCSLWCLA